MAENTEIVRKTEDPGKPKNIFTLFPKIELKIPFFDPKTKAESVVNEKPKNPTVSVGEDSESNTQKTDMVRFSEPRPIIPPPLELEAEESMGRTSNPLVLWQVYALTGFMVLRWVWARWKERKERGEQKEPSDDNQSPADENQSLDDEEYHNAQ